MTFHARTRAALSVALAILVLIATGYSVWWYRMSAALKDNVIRWAAERNAAGWKVTTGQMTADGYPFTVRLHLTEPSIFDAAGDGWQGAPLIAEVSPFDPRGAHLSAPGRHRLAMAGRDVAEFTAAAATADLSFDQHGVEHGVIALSDVASGATRLAHLTATAQRLAIGKVDHTVPTLSVSADADHLELPNDPRYVLGHSLTSAHLEARLLGEVPPGSLKQSLAAWRDDGGTVEIDSLALNWPPIGLTGNATLALDGDMQPMLAGRCTIRGLFEAIDALTRAGTVRAKDASVAKLVLGVLSKPGPDGTQELTVPLTVQNHTVYLGPAALLTLPQVEW